MILYKKKDALITHLRHWRREGKQIGFVPTMGALHEGHLSLLAASLAANPVNVVSIFVNPTQFNDAKDFEKYPVTLEKDLELLEKAGATVVFLPSVKEIYPEGTNVLQHFDMGYLETILEGRFRPGHFQGVCNVMFALLTIVNPDSLYMGQKDYQQCMVVKRLLDIMKLPVKLITCPTLRENDGLALSSRNLRLNPEERKKAIGIYNVLTYIKNHYKEMPFNQLEDYASRYLTEHGFSKVDYISIADAGNLKPIEKIRDADRIVALAAAFMNEVRLIDNMILQ